MVVHPGHGNFHGTLVHALMWHCKDLPQISGETRPGLVHRLDKNTSGLIIIGKTEHALTHLSKQFFDRTIKRHYIALVWATSKKIQEELNVILSETQITEKYLWLLKMKILENMLLQIMK